MFWASFKYKGHLLNVSKCSMKQTVPQHRVNLKYKSRNFLTLNVTGKISCNQVNLGNKKKRTRKIKEVKQGQKVFNA